ncbi:MAG: LamG domain-containing protein [Clostridiales bacterium]|nr:LamG domain-containing protein [Clostridiales bacterium]
MNLNGFYALCCESGGYAEIPWNAPSVNQFSISAQFIPDALTAQGVLFSLGSAFFVKIDNGRVQLTGDGFNNFSDETVLLQRCKNTIIAIYDGTKISVYCNGSLLLQQAALFNPAAVTYLRIGESSCQMYICKVTIFHRQLTGQEIQSSLVAKLTDYSRQIDFTKPTVSLDVNLHQCRIENCVYTLDCRNGKLTMPYSHLPEEYTLTFSFYAFNHEYDNGILFNSPHMCIRLWDQYGICSPRISIEHDGHRYNTPFAIKTKQWTNLTVVFGNSHIKIYFDGVIKHEISYNPSSETGDFEFGQFDGYLDSCAIIKCALSQSEISDYLNQPPEVFDKDVLYLFNFYDKLLQESCYGTAMLPSGSEIILAKGTGAGIRENKSMRAPQSERTYSDFVNWQIYLILRLLVEWLHEQLGIYPNKGVRTDCEPWEIDVNLHNFIHKEILSMKEAQILICHYDNLDPQELLDLIQAMKQNGTLKKLMDYLYQEDDNQDSVSDIIMALLAAALLATLLALLSNVVKGVPPVPSPPSPPQTDIDDDNDDDDDEKKKKTYAFIKQTSLKGDLSIEFDTKDISQDNERIAVFFVHGGSSNICLEESLSYKGDDGEFTVFAENKDGKVLPDFQQNISFSGNKSVKISLDIHREEFKNNYGKCTETLRWRCESSDGKQSQFLGEANYEFYFLENAPCKLWEDKVHIECLKLCADCAEYIGSNSKGFVRDYAEFIHHEDTISDYENDFARELNTTTHVYRKAYSKISAPQAGKSVFDAVNFAKDYRSGNCRISYNDKVYSSAVFGYLNGHDTIQVLWLSANMSYWSNDNKLISTRLLIKDSNSLLGFYCLEDSSHCVLMDTEGKIYDSKLNSYGLTFSDDSKRVVTGENSADYYREKNYLEGSHCEISYSLNISKWELDNLSADDITSIGLDGTNTLLEKPDIAWVRPRADGGYEHVNRTDEDSYIWKHIHNMYGNRADFEPYFNAVCHSISSYDIDVIIARICTEHRLNSLGLLQSLISALYPADNNREDIGNRYHRITVRLAEHLSRCLAHGNILTDNVITHFCFLAANAPGNLRMGKSEWNAFVGSHFDPQSWFYYGNPNAKYVICEQAFDEECESGQLANILYGRYPGIPALHDNDLAFYLPNMYDAIRIHNLRALGHQVRIRYGCVEDAGPEYYPIIYSSSNWFGYYENRDVYRNLPEAIFPNIHIYYPDGDRWIPL